MTATDFQTVAANETAVRAMHDAFRRRDFPAGAQLFAPLFSNHGKQVPREAVVAVWTDICTRFPDARLDVLDLVAEGGWVVVRNAYSGTHRGVGQLPVDGGFMVGLPPTGRPFSVEHIHMYRFQDGLIVEHYACRDDIEMMAQLGLPLALPGVEAHNRAVIERMHEAMRQRGLTAQLEFFAPMVRSHGFPATRDDIRAVLEDIETTFPDVSFEVHEIVAEGDRVMGRYTLRGTHLGVQRLPFVHGGFLAGAEPTGRSFTAQHVHIFRLQGGLIVEHDAVQDNLEMARQLGLTVQAPARGE
ncbi:ester cyclase [Deinococcus apachensis]|uniref:ester cyclase n=1 Tax=Deinococcus apachensis TaxID=309886 RepID=UPI00036EE694|nr:ester cyclase [Deinococcus apachensis]